MQHLAPVAHASPENGATDTAAAKAAAGADALPSEMLPPQQGVGQLLSPEEVRYCVFQGRRLGYLRDQIVSNDSVQRFNTLLADFNSRCKSFRYEGDALQSANKPGRRKARSAQGRRRQHLDLMDG